MKTTIKIAVIAMMGMSFGIKAQSTPMEGNKYHYYGPNSSWNEYLKVGGNGRNTDKASVVATNGNLHLDSKNGFSLYLNHYSKGNTFINPQGGFVGIGTSSPSNPLHILSNVEHHQLKLEGKEGKHSWIQFYPSGSGVKNWQAGANTNGFSIYNITNSRYDLTIANSGSIGVGTKNPDSNSGLHMYENKYTLYGPNSSWGAYLQVGGNGRTTSHASVVATNGNLHLDSKETHNIYLNHYSKGNTFINTTGGNVGIGTTNPGSWKLAVNGQIIAKEIKVETGWSDFVFYEDYDLPNLTEVENHIKEKGHLKDIPSAKEVEENGIFLGEMDAKLLQKIEELTLYTIAQDKDIKELKKAKSEIAKQQKEINAQKKEIEKLKKQNSEIQELKVLVQKLLKDKN